MTGVVLLALLAVLGLTIVRIGQLMWLHLFLGLLLIGPVLLKITSTGYRFLRYYTRDAVYRSKGPPTLLLRAIGPVIGVSTVMVFVTGVVLLFNGPAGRSTLVLLHKVSFIVWVVFMAIHVVFHLPNLGRNLRAARSAAGASGQALTQTATGEAGRWIALTGALVGGLVLALVLLPHYGVWTAPGAIHHHGH